jgi:hypothetical protein
VSLLAAHFHVLGNHFDMTWKNPSLVAVAAANGDNFKKRRSTLRPCCGFTRPALWQSLTLRHTGKGVCLQ